MHLQGPAAVRLYGHGLTEPVAGIFADGSTNWRRGAAAPQNMLGAAENAIDMLANGSVDRKARTCRSSLNIRRELNVL